MRIHSFKRTEKPSGKRVVVDDQITTRERSNTRSKQLVEGEGGITAQGRSQGQAAIIPNHARDIFGDPREGSFATDIKAQYRGRIIVNAMQRGRGVHKDHTDSSQAARNGVQTTVRNLNVTIKGIRGFQIECA